MANLYENERNKSGAGFAPADNMSASGMAQQAGEAITEVAGRAQEVAIDQIDRLADMIRRKPLQATGIAAGIGFVLALLARR